MTLYSPLTLLVFHLTASIPMFVMAALTVGLCIRYRRTSPRYAMLLAGLTLALTGTALAARLFGATSFMLFGNMTVSYELIGVVNAASQLCLGAAPLTLFILACAFIGSLLPSARQEHE